MANTHRVRVLVGTPRTYYVDGKAVTEGGGLCFAVCDRCDFRVSGDLNICTAAAREHSRKPHGWEAH